MATPSPSPRRRHESISRISAVGLITVAVPILTPIPASAAELKVVTLGDAGDSTCDATCTLRDAILAADATTVLDTIIFDIPDSPITLTSALPGITHPVIIDGFSDPTSERVELDGSAIVGPADGLRFSTADVSTVTGLVINGFSDDGIHFQVDAERNRAEGNYIGTDLAGTGADPNGANGIHVQGPDNVIGGSSAVTRNVISGNSSNGVRIAGAMGNRVEGNYIGTNATGASALPNADGVSITSAATNNVIGGTTAGLRNVISGNDNNGVRIFGLSTTGNVVQGNYIGRRPTVREVWAMLSPESASRLRQPETRSVGLDPEPETSSRGIPRMGSRSTVLQRRGTTCWATPSRETATPRPPTTSWESISWE